nr:MAG TPA: Replication initiation and membrane attachment [Caudoviricetes sp.]DAQ32097.1 MAG TPA: Replication initiation and membrane attachment [Caudoviricetes sp.]
MAQDDKKSFVAYLSWFDALEEYSDAEVGQLMRALARYAKNGEEPEFSDRGMRGNWKFMCSDVKRASEKWDETRKKRSNAGKRGMAKRWGKPDDITKITNDNNVNDDITKITVDVDVNGDVDVDGDVDVVKRDNTAAVDMELSKIVQHYQRAIGDFPRSALEKLQKWRQEYSTEMILLAIDKAAEAGKRSWNYINGILSGWQRDGIRTPGDVAANEQRRQEQPRGKQATESTAEAYANIFKGVKP